MQSQMSFDRSETDFQTPCVIHCSIECKFRVLVTVTQIGSGCSVAAMYAHAHMYATVASGCINRRITTVEAPHLD